MTSELQAALSAMRLHRAAVVENNHAMLVLIREAVNMEKALQFYANPLHYFDGVLMRCDEQGLTIPDEGMVAKWALHQMDASGGGVDCGGGGLGEGGGGPSMSDSKHFVNAEYADKLEAELTRLRSALQTAQESSERLATALRESHEREKGLHATIHHFSTRVAPLLEGETDKVKAIQLLCKAGRDELERAEAAEAKLQTAEQERDFQKSVRLWVLECFGSVIADDITERSFRFIEEALELVQSIGCTREQAHVLVDYVFDRPIGDTVQEVGGVLVTLAAMTSAAGVDMEAAGRSELARISTPETIAKIRRKQASKRGVVSHAAAAALPGEWSTK